MSAKVTVGLVFLVGPAMCVFVWRLFRNEASVTRRLDSRLTSVVAGIVLMAGVVYLLAPAQRQVLEADFLPLRGFAVLLLSGAAFAVALFPDMVAGRRHPFGRGGGVGPTLIIPVIAWLWIGVMVALAIVRSAG